MKGLGATERRIAGANGKIPSGPRRRRSAASGSPGEAGSTVWPRLFFRRPQGHATPCSPRDRSLGQQLPFPDPKDLEHPRPRRLDRPRTRKPARVGGRGAGRPRGRPKRPLPLGLSGPTRASLYLGGRHGGAATAARLAQASLARRPLGG